MSKADIKRNIRIGAFTVAAMAVFALALLTLGRKSGLLTTYYNLIATYSSVQGLKSGQPVWLSGLEVGLVDEIRLSPDKKGQIEVVLIIEQEYQEWIRADSVARLETKGLLGDKIVNINLGSQTEPYLKDGDEIRTEPPFELNEVFDEAGQILGSFKSAFEKVEKVIADIGSGEGTLGQLATNRSVYEKADRALGNLDGVLSKLNRGQGTLGKLVVSDELYERVNGLVGRTDTIVAGLEQGEGTAGKLLKDEALYGELTSAATSLRTVVERLERGEGTLGKATAEAELHDSLVELLGSVNDLATDIKENPKRYFKVSVF